MNNSGFGATWHPCKMESFLILRASCKKSIRFVIIISLLDNAPNYHVCLHFEIKIKILYIEKFRENTQIHEFVWFPGNFHMFFYSLPKRSWTCSESSLYLPSMPSFVRGVLHCSAICLQVFSREINFTKFFVKLISQNFFGLNWIQSLFRNNMSILEEMALQKAWNIIP